MLFHWNVIDDIFNRLFQTINRALNDIHKENGKEEGFGKVNINDAGLWDLEVNSWML